jgi:proline iminopeptidase
MPANIRDSIRIIEAAKDFTNPKYSDLLSQSYFPEHILHLPLNKWPPIVMLAMSKMNVDYERIILGLDQFTLGGELTHWNIDAQIARIVLPTLVIGARYDFMMPAHMKWMSTQVKNGSYLYCPNGSHLAFYDDLKVYMKGIIKYIKAVDKGAEKCS